MGGLIEEKLEVSSSSHGKKLIPKPGPAPAPHCIDFMCYSWFKMTDCARLHSLCPRISLFINTLFFAHLHEGNCQYRIHNINPLTFGLRCSVNEAALWTVSVKSVQLSWQRTLLFPPRDTTVVFPFHLLLMVLVLDGLNVARVHKTLHLDLF